MTSSYTSHLISVVNTYKQVGLFKNQSAKAIVELFEQKYDLDVEDEKFQLIRILELSETGVWFEWHECDIFQPSPPPKLRRGYFMAIADPKYLVTYTKILKAWAKLSGGVFDPKRIRETWESPEGPILLSFQFAGEKISFEAQFIGGYLDLGVLIFVNSLLGRAQRFELITDYWTAPVLFLSKKQTNFLRRELNVPFTKFSNRMKSRVRRRITRE